MAKDRSTMSPRAHPVRRLAARLRDDRRGAAILEFAVVSIPFVALLLASLQTSIVFFAQQNLETAAEKASRTILTGTAQKGGMTQAQFRAQVCTKLPSFMDCAKMLVDVRTAASFADVTTNPPTTITTDADGNPNNSLPYQPGNAGDIVIMRVLYLWPVEPGPLGFSLSNTSLGRRTLVATRVFKQEPWS